MVQKCHNFQWSQLHKKCKSVVRPCQCLPAAAAPSSSVAAAFPFAAASSRFLVQPAAWLLDTEALQPSGVRKSRWNPKVGTRRFMWPSKYQNGELCANHVEIPKLGTKSFMQSWGWRASVSRQVTARLERGLLQPPRSTTITLNINSEVVGMGIQVFIML